MEVTLPFLDTALAFALTMLAVAMVTTKIVGFLKNTSKLRKETLKEMLTEYFGKELKPVVQREFNRLKKDISDEFVSELANTANNHESELFDENELATLVEVSTEELTERLKRSALGQKLLTELGDQAQSVFNELGQRYEVVCKKFTESFRKNSRKWAIGVSLALALACNIDSIHIVDSYIRNEGMRQVVIAQRDALIEDYNALIESFDEETGNNSVTKDELEQTFRDSQEQLDVLTTVGFPIGWSYFPHSGFREGEYKDFQRRNNVGGWLLWVIGILLTACLAGLGTPFWYDTVTGISRILDRTRTGKKPAEKPVV